MTRNLPWQKSSTTINRGKRSSTVTSSTPKRLKTNSVRGQSESEGTASPVKGLKRNEKARTPSTSPPPEPPEESFMLDGLENDDKYRMVEDEFLTVAQKFTVHLHAAEYKRQQTQVKARNADAIRSISRPVSTKMPEQTKRKVEAHERSLAQKNLVEGLRKQAKEDEESDCEDMPYVGTVLHSFMDSPRKKAVSLLRAGSINTATRAAAGFKKQHTQSNSPGKSSGLATKRTVDRGPEQLDGSETESDADDDLDLPIPLPELGVSNTEKHRTGDSLLNSKSTVRADKPTVTTTLPQPRESKKPKLVTLGNEPQIGFKHNMKNTQEARTHAETTTARISSINAPSTSKTAPSRLSRLDYARMQKVKQEVKIEEEKELDVIPSFL
ncbi:hypothetical protein GLAREA_05101 [Glarea lozoyensis ATCC 20868]|uniref:Uncharacterized protein n=1 Tax=Glarea lozoyensis (strain ATCC 20868 / MF5171) TaxID=1116229 RepID=S3EBT8_GLAL2|nr:uncharacterized protein GLAREA_05101 [Glarea lozoyensis ATCC 20868]EPE35763.1 hypothetical protein GLAREA_05101 [Glarea lozoyensis ATCC 20868]